MLQASNPSLYQANTNILQNILNHQQLLLQSNNQSVHQATHQVQSNSNI